jgi:PPOX class probable F420-dependent enzyme
MPDHPDTKPAQAVARLAVDDAGVALSERGLRFLQAPGRYAVIATIGADGSPNQAVIWYRLDGTTIVLNSAQGRRWPTDLQRDPRVSITIADGYDWVSAAGTVEAIHDQAIAQADIAAMAVAYEDAGDAAKSIARFRTQHRISFRLHPARFHEEFED